MQILTKALIVIVYPLLLLAWLVNQILRRDPLRLYDVPSGESYWIERRAQQLPVLSYFSEESCSEGSGEGSTSRLLARLLRVIARVYTPPRQVSGTMYKPSADREQGIPDEVYTLW